MPTINLSIDVSLLKKDKFKNITRKNGAKAIFCDLTLIETPEGKFGDFMVVQSSTKEERESGVKNPILGNGRISRPRGEAPQPDAPNTPTDDTPVPF